MIADTYRSMGLDFTPNYSDIDSYMRMTDTDRDGMVSLAEFEAVIIRSLKARGIKIDWNL